MAHNHAKAESDEYAIGLLESAWTIIANAGGGDWDLEKPIWQDAAIRFREHYFKFLAGREVQHNEVNK